MRKHSKWKNSTHKEEFCQEIIPFKELVAIKDALAPMRKTFLCIEMPSSDHDFLFPPKCSKHRLWVTIILNLNQLRKSYSGL